MNEKTTRVTAADLELLERSTAQALALVTGLLAEAVGSHKLAYHFGAALDAMDKAKPNKKAADLLDPAFQLVLLKAMRAAPDDPVLQGIAATYRARQTKH